MKLGKLGMYCGNCDVIDWCAEPFSELCLCREDGVLADMEEAEYTKRAEETFNSAEFAYWINEKICSESEEAIIDKK